MISTDTYFIRKKESAPKFLSLFFILLLSFCLVACGQDKSLEEEETAEEESAIQIGLSFDSFVIERWQKDSDVFVSTAKENGAEVNVQNANGDVETQISQIRYLIQKKVDVLVIVCVDSYSLADVVQEAQDAGIKVIAYDRLICEAGVDLYISFDNEKVGNLMAQALLSEPLPNKKVLMLNGAKEDHNVSMVESGFRKEMKKNQVEIVDTMYADGWKAERATEYLATNPQMIGQVDAIMCGNDNIATNVIRFLSERRMAGVIQVVGQDADLEACQRIVEGTQVMTVYKPVEKLATAAAQFACMMAKGEALPLQEEGFQTIQDGKEEITYYVLEPIAVSKDNMEETIINSRFHLAEDVYLNMPNR